MNSLLPCQIMVSVSSKKIQSTFGIVCIKTEQSRNKKSNHGIGLGPYFVNKVISLHHGTVTATSEPQVKLRLPCDYRTIKVKNKLKGLTIGQSPFWYLILSYKLLPNGMYTYPRNVHTSRPATAPTMAPLDTDPAEVVLYFKFNEVNKLLCAKAAEHLAYDGFNEVVALFKDIDPYIIVTSIRFLGLSDRPYTVHNSRAILPTLELVFPIFIPYEVIVLHIRA